MFGHLRKRYLFSTRAMLLKELICLEKLLEMDKAILPGVIAYQDRGGMTFLFDINFDANL